MRGPAAVAPAAGGAPAAPAAPDAYTNFVPS
jgi:hypothetical protein